MSTPESGDRGTFSPIEPIGPASPVQGRAPAGPHGSPAGPLPAVGAPHETNPQPQPVAHPSQSTPFQTELEGLRPTSPAKRANGLQTASLIINALLLGIVLVGAFLFIRQQIVVRQNESSSRQNATAARKLTDEVARLQRINTTLTKKLADSQKRSDSAASTQLTQTRTVITGVSADLSACSAAINEVSGRLVELIRSDPAGAGTTVSGILNRCDVVADHAAAAVEALDE